MGALNLKYSTCLVNILTFLGGGGGGISAELPCVVGLKIAKLYVCTAHI
jgi:hypothetical protein